MAVHEIDMGSSSMPPRMEATVFELLVIGFCPAIHSPSLVEKADQVFER
jgi:hypothetical protein